MTLDVQDSNVSKLMGTITLDDQGSVVGRFIRNDLLVYCLAEVVRATTPHKRDERLWDAN